MKRIVKWRYFIEHTICTYPQHMQEHKYQYIYTSACCYEIIKLFYFAALANRLPENMLLYKYISIAALCTPVFPWFILIVREVSAYSWLSLAALLKFSAICAEFLYIFQNGFDIIRSASGVPHNQAEFIKAVFLFLAIDTVLLFFSYVKGSTYYANHTDR